MQLKFIYCHLVCDITASLFVIKREKEGDELHKEMLWNIYVEKWKRRLKVVLHS